MKRQLHAHLRAIEFNTVAVQETVLLSLRVLGNNEQILAARNKTSLRALASMSTLNT